MSKKRDRVRVRTSPVVTAAVVHRLEFGPIDGFVAIIVNFPDHVLYVRLREGT